MLSRYQRRRLNALVRWVSSAGCFSPALVAVGPLTGAVALRVPVGLGRAALDEWPFAPGA